MWPPVLTPLPYGSNPLNSAAADSGGTLCSSFQQDGITRGDVLKQSQGSHSGDLHRTSQAHLTFMVLWFQLKRVALHTSYYTATAM